jgi:hypothetical protein
MTKNITFTADDTLIDEAREAARNENTTLNELFRQWLTQYAQERRAQRALKTMERIGSYASSGGRKFGREEMNERD